MDREEEESLASVLLLHGGDESVKPLLTCGVVPVLRYHVVPGVAY